MPESYPVVPERRAMGIIGWIALVIAATAAILWLPTLAAGQEVAAPATPEPAAVWWVSLLGSDAFWNAVAVALTFLIAMLSKMAWVQNAKKNVNSEVWNSFEAAVIKTYHEKVKQLKGAAGDHKITPEEAAALRTAAWDSAKEIAVGPAKGVVVSMARPAADAIIERVLGYVKRNNSTPPEHDTAGADK